MRQENKYEKEQSRMYPKDRQQGDPNWSVLKGIDPGSATGVQYIANLQGALMASTICGGLGACIQAPNTIYPNGVPAYMSRAFLNAIGVPTSDGILTNIKGNALPNSPEQTIKIGIQKTWHALDGVDITARVDYYKQDESYAREFNRSWDKIPSWDQTNFSLLINNPDGSYYIFINCTKLLKKRNINNTIELCKYFVKKYSIGITPGEAFGYEKYIRVSVANSHENIVIFCNKFISFINKQRILSTVL